MKFINYLEKVFLEENPQIIKDQMEDAFDNWLSGLDVNDVIDYANDAFEIQKKKEAEVLKLTQQVADKIKEKDERIALLMKMLDGAVGELKKINDMAMGDNVITSEEERSQQNEPK